MSKGSSSSSSIAVKDMVHKLQLCLLDGINSENQLLVAGSLLSKSDYHDVVTERSIAQRCGYPLCPHSLPSSSPSEPPKKGRYRISLKEHKVYDLLETRMYCSTTCVVNSQAYAGSLQDERSLAPDAAKIEQVTRLFEGLGSKAEVGSGENGDFGLRSLSIKEKEDASVGGGVMSMEEWIGPSNAIEGYVPQHNHSSRNKPGPKLKASKLKKDEESIINEIDFMSTIITQDDGYSISKEPSGQTKKIPSTKLKESGKKKNRKGTDDRLTVSVDPTTNPESAPETKLNESKDVENYKPRICEEAQPSSSGLKSSLKSSGATRTRCSVTWADEKADGAHDQTPYGSSEMENEAPDAVEPEPASVKWSKQAGIVESDFFDSEDSWFDSPPEEFTLDLSPFATMFMSLFAWISSSTLAYVYGHDDSFHEEYASINGRGYPCKIVLTDGRSSEIKQTLAGCLARALPGLVYDLRLATPLSTVEYGMGCLLDTMSFLDPVPPLRMKQWQVLALLFIDALSVCGIPALAPHMTNRRRFFQKVFDDGGISREEYEVLKDLILPLGRVPQFATQSGA